MKKNECTLEELKVLFEKQARLISPSVMDVCGIAYECVTLETLTKAGTKEELVIYVFSLMDGLYVCPVDRFTGTLNVSRIGKITDRYLKLMVRKKERMKKEQETLDNILNHPSQRLKTLYL